MIFVIPAGLIYTFGRMIGDTRQGWALLAAVLVLLVPLVLFHMYAEQQGNPLLAPLGIDQSLSHTQSGGNMEGKETRLGIAASALFATVTTATSTGAVNAMHDSLTPLGGLVTLFNMQLGEVIPGGVGSGLYSLLVFAIVGVFIAGLMIGRTPEYLGKKIEAYDVKMAMITVLIFCVLALGLTGWSIVKSYGTSSISNAGPHGLSQVLYAFTSMAGNNGSAFAGLNGNTLWFNMTLGLAMLLGRFCYVVPVLALAGSLAAKKKIPTSAGTFPTDGPLFVGLLAGVIVILYLLQYFPALSLGPVVEQFLMLGGKTY